LLSTLLSSKRGTEFFVAVAMLLELDVGKKGDNDASERNGSRAEQIEKILEKNVRFLRKRKERKRAIWEDKSPRRINGVIVIEFLSWSMPDIAAVNVEHEEVSKYSGVFSFEFWFKRDV
jgi:hypothetical protein